MQGMPQFPVELFLANLFLNFKTKLLVLFWIWLLGFDPENVLVSYREPLFLPEVTCPGKNTKPTPAVVFVWRAVLLVRNFATNPSNTIIFLLSGPPLNYKKGA